jgi:hypothetical protein
MAEFRHLQLSAELAQSLGYCTNHGFTVYSHVQWCWFQVFGSSERGGVEQSASNELKDDFKLGQAGPLGETQRTKLRPQSIFSEVPRNQREQVC